MLNFPSVSKIDRYVYSNILVWIGGGGKTNFEGDFFDRSEVWGSLVVVEIGKGRGQRASGAGGAIAKARSQLEEVEEIGQLGRVFRVKMYRVRAAKHYTQAKIIAK